MNILVTGGAGYIGCYIVKELCQNNNVVIVDNLSTSSIEGIKANPTAKFYEKDIRNKEEMIKIFSENKIDVVIHMAALLDVEESSRKPLEYYDVNINGTIVLLEVMKQFDVKNIVFSSTAAVYGNVQEYVKITEDFLTDPLNNYGYSKLVGEKILQTISLAEELNYVIFRYFNVAGGKKHGYGIEKMKTLIPRVLSSIKSEQVLQVYGNDYPSDDGTCVRDYIHVEDLAKAHALAAKKIFNEKNISGIYNLGSSKGYSVFEVINESGKVIGKAPNFDIVARRVGDPFYSVASSEKSEKILGWQRNYDKLGDIILDMWRENNGQR